jgi:HEAT repeat protein
MKSSFDQMLESLLDDSQPLPTQQLHVLSDIDSSHLAQLQSAWPQLSESRKCELLKELGNQASERFELLFESVNRFAITDPDPSVREIAIRNLWECEDPALALSLLNALSSDRSPEVRSASARALGLFVWLGELEKIDTDLLHQIEEGLLAASNEDESNEVRKLSIESLGFSSHSEVPDLIQQAYDSDDDSYKQSALFAMGRSASKRWAPMVIHEMGNASPQIRLISTRAAGELELKEAVESLIDLLEDVDIEVREAAIWSLSQIGGDDATDALVALVDIIDDEFTELLEDALEYLAFIDGTQDFSLNDFDESEDPTP